jgi:hypothetical protein
MNFLIMLKSRVGPVQKNRVVDPDPDWESGYGSRGKKTKKFQCKKLTFIVIFKKNFTT